MNDNVKELQMVQEYIDNNQTDKAYELCTSVLDEWEYSKDVLENFAILRICAIINSIPLESFSNYKCKLNDDDGPYNNDPELEKIVEMLEDSVYHLVIFLTDDESKNEKYEFLGNKIFQLVREKVFKQLDIYISEIISEKSYNKFSSYYSGYLRLGLVVYMILANFQVAVGASEDIELNTLHDEIEKAKADKLFMQSKVLLERVNEAITDFPYISDTDTDELTTLYLTICTVLEGSIIENDEENDTELQTRIERLKLLIAINCDFLNVLVVCEGERFSLVSDEEIREERYNEIVEMTNEVKKYDKEYTHPQVVRNFQTTVSKEKSKGCYIATAVYGSYDCPEVWTLRRYRDNTLAKTWYGRTFIKTYYAISPTLVKWFGHTEWFKKMWKGKLDRMVLNLQSEGVQSTPYDDVTW